MSEQLRFRVLCAPPAALEFRNPTQVVRARTVGEAREALDAAQGAMNDGQWIAGYISYELGAAFAGRPVRNNEWPLLALGFFGEPSPLPRIEATGARCSPLLPLVERDRYDRTIDEIKAAIYDGDVYQVNYTIPFALHAPEDRLGWWWRIAQETNAGYQVYVEDEERTICSWSPELFLNFTGSRVETRPMKGTAPLEHIALLENEKNRAEHLMIVDLLRNDLHRVCDNVAVDSLFGIERYPTFATMTTTVGGTLREGTSFGEILEATFPCGSITGAPKRAAMEYIARMERFARGPYCGTIGFLSPTRHGWWNVAIRTAQISTPGSLARFDVGGGIVADSDANDEWREILIKSESVRSHAAPCILLETFASNADRDTKRSHLARLARTARAFSIPCDTAAIAAQLEAHLAGVEMQRLVRLRLSSTGSIEIKTEPLTPQDEPVPVLLTDLRVRSDDPFLQWKTSWRPIQERAAEIARAQGCFEGLLRNERNELTEGARTTLFIARDGLLWTPPLRSGLLPGILRERLIREGARERVLTEDDLHTAEAIYVGNSARGLLRAKML